MAKLFEEIDYRPTRMGPISLRRRRLLSLDIDVFEVLLGDEHLMSSLFTVGETQLARLGLAEAPDRRLKVLVGGLGLGYTAKAALEDPRVIKVVVVEALEAVIDWHNQGKVPLGLELSGDDRCEFICGDFFALMAGDLPPSLGTFDVVLLDVDHSPRNVLNPSHAQFYSAQGLSSLARRLTPDGVFALWSDEVPDAEFESVLAGVFPRSASHRVQFDNPLTSGTSACTVYVGAR